MKASQRIFYVLLMAIFAALISMGGSLEALSLNSGQACKLFGCLTAVVLAKPMSSLAVGILIDFLRSSQAFARCAAEDFSRLKWLFEKLLLTGGLILMAGRCFPLPDDRTAMPSQISQLYSALSLVILFLFMMVVLGFTNEWMRLRAMALLPTPAADEEEVAQPPARSILGGTYAALLGLLFAIAIVGTFIAPGDRTGMDLAEKSPTPEKERASMEDDDAGGEDTGAGAEDTGRYGEIIRSLTVSQEFASEASTNVVEGPGVSPDYAGRGGSGALPRVRPFP